MSYVITTTARATRIHRSTCKRANSRTSVLHVAPRVLVAAKAASCCKPSTTDVDDLVYEAAAAQRAGAESVAMYRQAAEPVAEEATPAPAEEQPAAEEAPEQATVQFSGRGISLSVWRTLGIHAAQAVAHQYGLKVAADKATRTVTLQGNDAQAAAQRVGQLWDTIWAEWKAQGATTAEYHQALEAGRTESRKFRRIWIQGHLAN